MSIRRRPAPAALLLLGALAALAPGERAARASDDVTDDTSERRIHFTLSPEVVDVTALGAGSGSLFGMGVGAGVLYALSSRWGLAGGVRQMFTSTGDFLFTNFDARLTCALTGSLVTEERAVGVTGQTLYEYAENFVGGLRAQLSGTQYLFTTALAVVPFSGFGASVYYDFPTRTHMNYVAGVRTDYAIGNSRALLIPQLFGGIAFSF